MVGLFTVSAAIVFTDAPTYIDQGCQTQLFKGPKLKTQSKFQAQHRKPRIAYTIPSIDSLSLGLRLF